MEWLFSLNNMEKVSSICWLNKCKIKRKSGVEMLYEFSKFDRQISVNEGLLNTSAEASIIITHLFFHLVG